MKAPSNNKLKEYRLKAGLLQKDIGLAIGFKHWERISRWETGQAMPSVNNLFLIAQVLKVFPHELYPELYPLEGSN